MKTTEQIKNNLGTINYLQNCCQDLLLKSFETFFDSHSKRDNYFEKCENSFINLSDFEQMFEDPDGGENGIQVMLKVKSIHQDISRAIFVELENESGEKFYDIIDRYTLEEQKAILNYLLLNH